eukprot:3633588-Rhodomonas_salina.1
MSSSTSSVACRGSRYSFDLLPALVTTRPGWYDVLHPGRYRRLCRWYKLLYGVAGCGTGLVVRGRDSPAHPSAPPHRTHRPYPCPFRPNPSTLNPNTNTLDPRP